MHFLSQDLEDYIEQHSEKEPAHLAALNKETYQKILLPRMLSGHFQGRVLSMLSKLRLPKNPNRPPFSSLPISGFLSLTIAAFLLLNSFLYRSAAALSF